MKRIFCSYDLWTCWFSYSSLFEMVLYLHISTSHVFYSRIIPSVNLFSQSSLIKAKRFCSCMACFRQFLFNFITYLLYCSILFHLIDQPILLNWAAVQQNVWLFYSVGIYALLFASSTYLIFRHDGIWGPEDSLA